MFSSQLVARQTKLARSDFRCKRLLETEVCGCGCGRMQKAADAQSFCCLTHRNEQRSSSRSSIITHTHGVGGDLILRIEPFENRNIVHFFTRTCVVVLEVAVSTTKKRVDDSSSISCSTTRLFLLRRVALCSSMP